MPRSVLVAPVGRPRTTPILNVAHRGASTEAPENTLAAVRRAVGGPSHLVEVDVQRTRDGALILMHDTTLVRTTDVRRVFPDRHPWLVGDFTYAEIRRLDAGSWKSPHFAGERIPTLIEVIELLQPTRSGLLLELKATALHPGMVDETVAELRSVPGYLQAATDSGRLVVQSFDHAAMRQHRLLEPSVPVGLLGTPSPAQLPSLARWATQVNPGLFSVDAAYVSAVRDLGMDCLVWTVNRAPAMRRALRMGVDGVITDRPDTLQQVLDRFVVPA